MKPKTAALFLASMFLTVCAVYAAGPETIGDPVRVIVFGAHPDDCDVLAGGTAALYSEMGHEVKFVSMTNGNKGHHEMAPDELAARRKEEMREAGEVLGVEYECMDNPDGELLPTFANRLEVIRLIRSWQADVVITHRPNDYHPDHRYGSQIVQDAAYMIAVPLVAPEVKALSKPVVFLYLHDNFRKPNPFSPDIVVDITAALPKKIDALCAHSSQVFEWIPWIEGFTDPVPTDMEGRRRYVADHYLSIGADPRLVEAALEWYSPERITVDRTFELFEVCEYGAIPSREEIKRLFPMLPR